MVEFIEVVIKMEKNEYLGIKSFPDNVTSYPITIHLYEAVRNGKPLETVTEFADRCKECGARYGKLLKQGKMTITETTTQENLLQTLFNLEAENERLHDAIDKIRAEISDLKGTFPNEYYLAIIDKYRKEQSNADSN